MRPATVIVTMVRVRVAAWVIASEGPSRLTPSAVAAERDLETWIENDPALVAEGLRIVARQLQVEGGRLDLLGVDPRGRLVLVEIKRGTLYRETVAQALDYASSIASMPIETLRDAIKMYVEKDGRSLADPQIAGVLAASETESNREVAVVVVGTGRDASLHRLTGFLSGSYGVPIQVVTFEVFDVAGQQVLIREITDSDVGDEAVSPATASEKMEAVFARANSAGCGEQFQVLYDAAVQNGLYARAYKQAIMYTPPTNKTKMLFTTWTHSNDSATTLWVSPCAFAEFYNVTVEEATERLGEDGYHTIKSTEDARQFAASLDALIVLAEQREDVEAE